MLQFLAPVFPISANGLTLADVGAIPDNDSWTNLGQLMQSNQLKILLLYIAFYYFNYMINYFIVYNNYYQFN